MDRGGLNRAIMDGTEPRTRAGQDLLRYAGNDLDRDVFRRAILKIEHEAGSAAMRESQR